MTFRAGFGRADITPRTGCRLTGYGNRKQGATGVHDPLLARALVLEEDGNRSVLLSCELCYLNEGTVNEVRAAIHARTGIPEGQLFLATTHTHSGPHDRDAENWSPRPLAERMADAVEIACDALQPARIGSAFGMLYGYSLNRRWLDRPVDPAVSVIRIDGESGRRLGLVTNFGCHAVVLGYDNYLISGDWPGYASRMMEDRLGQDATCLFFQGGAGNINPLVAGVRQRLRSGRPVKTFNESYYSRSKELESWGIGDRGGGTFDEAAELGEAFAEEALYVARGIETAEPTGPLWTEQIRLEAEAGPDEPEPPVASLAPTLDNPNSLKARGIPAEIMLLGIGDIVLVGQPGEVFSETAVRLRTRLRTLGYTAPVLVSYANGWISYLPEPQAFDEGGYEVSRANGLGTSRHFQTWVQEAVESVCRR